MFGPALNPNLAHACENGKGQEEEEEEEEEEEGFFCHVCRERVKSVSEEKHNTSTLHIFNQKHRPQERKASFDVLWNARPQKVITKNGFQASKE